MWEIARNDPDRVTQLIELMAMPVGQGILALGIVLKSVLEF
jgi:hypothetical protein